MDEALRRAYLAAMEIPVWIPRAEADAEAVAAEPGQREQVAHASMPPQASPSGARGSGGVATPVVQGTDGRARGLLEGLRGPRATRAPERSAPAAAGLRAEAGSGEQFLLLFVHAGGTLFIDEAAQARPSRAELELLGSLCFLFERERLQPEIQPFAWPPHAGRAAAHAGQARDAVLGRIAKLAEGMMLRRLVLLGELPARLVLGDSIDPAVPRIHHLERPECAVFAIPSLARMLAEPEAKRQAWQTLRLAHG